MKFIIFSLSILFVIAGCKKQEFNEFNFSYSNTFETDFSIKFNNSNDSVYLRENWNHNENKIPKSEKNYVSTLSKSQRNKLDSFIKNINFKSFDTIYSENYSDGESYNFYINKNGIKKSIRIHSYSAPKSLEKFASWIYETKKSLPLKETKRNFIFKSKFIYPKPPKAP